MALANAGKFVIWNGNKIQVGNAIAWFDGALAV
jgi:hypothetical protein